jgi:tetratricopeptide (TPR) repeat protein
MMCMDRAAGTCDPAFALQMGRAALSALGRDDGRESRLLDAEAWLAESKSDLKTARPLREKSLELALREAGGRLDSSVARAHGNLAQLMTWMGEDPTVQVEKAHAIYRQISGPYHPELAIGYEARGIYFGNQGKWKQAEEQFRHALEVRRHTFGEFHTDVAASHNNIAFLLFQAKEYERCLTEIRTALAIYELVDPQSRKVPDTASSMGEAEEALGRNAAALATYQRALAGLEAIVGPEHRDVASILVLLGRRTRRDGQFDEALSALRRAARIFEHVDGKEAQTLKDARAEIARAERHDRAE